MKRLISLLLCAAMTLSLAACGQKTEPENQTDPITQPEEKENREWEGAYYIELSDDHIEITSPDGKNIHSAVWASNNIVYYEEGHDFTYGEGEEGDAHSAEEAAEHTVLEIKEPGTYVLSGKLSAGQIAVDLGEEAKDDPAAVVTLVLNGVDITCTVAPAIIFYNVYECGSDDTETATKDVDTSAAGANVYINGGTENVVNGSYVARIYKPESVVLSADGTEVEEAKKLHKYDAAFYSRMSMNVGGDNSGILRINAENEGLDSELHLTINGGTIFIESGNDGINTNEDGVSVTTINGGNLTIMVTGETGEGDGIDSNGWLVINGGSVFASACSDSADAGIDSDMGIHIGAGATVIATGHMLDRIESADQTYVVFQFSQPQSGEEQLKLRDANGVDVLTVSPKNDYSVLLYSGNGRKSGDYTLWSGDTQLGHSGAQGGGMGGFGGGGRPGGVMPGGMQMPEGFDPENMPELPGEMERPEPAQKPENGAFPENMGIPGGFDPTNLPEPPEGTELPGGMQPPQGGFGSGGMGGFGGGQKATEETFTIEAKESFFSGIGELER